MSTRRALLPSSPASSRPVPTGRLPPLALLVLPRPAGRAAPLPPPTRSGVPLALALALAPALPPPRRSGPPSLPRRLSGRMLRQLDTLRPRTELSGDGVACLFLAFLRLAAAVFLRSLGRLWVALMRERYSLSGYARCRSARESPVPSNWGGLDRYPAHVL